MTSANHVVAFPSIPSFPSTQKGNPNQWPQRDFNYRALYDLPSPLLATTEPARVDKPSLPCSADSIKKYNHLTQNALLKERREKLYKEGQRKKEV